jgi:hypothetical protein
MPVFTSEYVEINNENSAYHWMPRIKINGLEKLYRLKPVEMHLDSLCLIPKILPGYRISVSTDKILSSRRVLTRGLSICSGSEFISTYKDGPPPTLNLYME